MFRVSSSLRPLDVEFMKALHEKVNIVPILAKADTLTPSEVKKKKIKARLISINKLLIYTCFNCHYIAEIHTTHVSLFYSQNTCFHSVLSLLSMSS